MEPRRVALTGGIATGKSTVAGIFAEAGAVILDADETARKVVQPSAPCWQELHELLGFTYFDEDGQLLRPKLRTAIIKDSHLRSRVNAILHPSISAEMQSAWKEWTERDPTRLVIFDIPLLFEARAEPRFDIVILAYVPREIQIERLMARDKISRRQAEATLTMQLPIEAKKERSHIIIDNSGDIQSTRSQVMEVMDRLQAPEV
jgi:dephospho-CoA kinase